MSQFVRNQPVAKRKRTDRKFLYLLFAALLSMAPMFWIIRKQSRLLNVGYEITRLQEMNARLQEEQVRLRAELTGETRPDLMFKRAHDLGLAPLVESQLVRVQVVDEVSETLVAGGYAP